MEPPAASKSKAWCHTTLWTAPCEHSLARSARRISYVRLCKLPCSNIRWSVTWSFLLQYAQHLRVYSSNSRVGAHSSKLWPYTDIGPKIGLGVASSPAHVKNGEAPGTHCLRMRLISPRCGDSGLFSDSSVSCDIRVQTRYSKIVRII